MSDIEFKTIETNGINLRLAMMGEGPLVIFCHGWPESWYSYRHQLPAIAQAGYKAVAYDVRGYGESDKPYEIEAYTMKNMTDDVVGIIDALGAASLMPFLSLISKPEIIEENQLLKFN